MWKSFVDSGFVYNFAKLIHKKGEHYDLLVGNHNLNIGGFIMPLFVMAC